MLWLLMPYAVGLVAGRLGLSVPLVPSLGFGLLLIVLSLCFALRDRDRAWVACLVPSLFLLGLCAFSLHRPGSTGRETLPAREAHLTLRCERLFAAKAPGRRSGIGTVLGADNHLRELLGHRVYFSLQTQEHKLLGGVEFEALAVLENLSPGEGTRSFSSYLGEAGVLERFQRGRVLKITRPASAYRKACDSLLGKMNDVLEFGVLHKKPELLAAYRAMVLGQINELSSEQNKRYSRSGTMHLFSISGMHIGVIALVLHGLAALACRPLLPRALLVLAALWLYVDATGCSPSALRAYLMVALIEISFLLRRPQNSWSCLVVSAFLVLAIDPLQLFGASFQLSYGIVAVLILYAAPLSEILKQWGNPWRLLPDAALEWPQKSFLKAWHWLLAALCAGVAASLIGLPAGVHFFGLLNPASLFVNLILIPLSSLVLLAGMMALIPGIGVWAGLSFIPNHAALLLLWLMEVLVRWFLEMPGSCYSMEFRWLWLGPALMSCVFLVCLISYKRRWKPGCLFWLLPTFVAAVLLLGLRPTAMP